MRVVDDDADRVVKRTDPKGTTFTTYDALDRIVNVREGSLTAAPVKEFTYDTLPGGLGKQVASIRHDASGGFINRVTGYDAGYRPTGRETVIPAGTATAGVAGTYTYGYTYTATGQPLTVTLPAVGGLAAENVVTRYDSDGLPESTSGQSWYTADVTYSPYGEPLRTVRSRTGCGRPTSSTSTPDGCNAPSPTGGPRLRTGSRTATTRTTSSAT
ncbi:hypothetical protein ACFRQM_27935 [Streptomyces sp. NPDC056831]|uniref:hypothetical protein n=1 Tax=Streptomyces sp. NPDC056831 TaxID=3345954 RepID=UPI0036CBB1B6